MSRQYNFAYDDERVVKLNGNKQNIRIVSNDLSNPVILFVHGGPGACDRNIALHSQGERLTALGYTMVVWDQRGAGKSFSPAIFLNRKLKVQDYIEDARALVEYLCKELNQEKIVVFGRSWGTMVCTMLCDQYPEHIAAYIAQGQIVEGEANEAVSWAYALEEARKAGNLEDVEKLEDIEPVKGLYPSALAMSAQRNLLSKYGGAEWKDRGGYFTHMVKPFLKYDGYHFWELPAFAIGGAYLSTFLWPQVVQHDFTKEIPELSVPVLMTIGRHDYNTPAPLAEEYFELLKAPVKKWTWFEESAHSPVSEEPEKWAAEVYAFLKEVL